MLHRPTLQQLIVAGLPGGFLAAEAHYRCLVSEIRCLGCGALVPEQAGPVHAYMLAAPGCWALYGSLQQWKGALTGDDGLTTAQRAVDCYAAQHATNPDRRNRQPVAVHLMSLCASIEQGVSGTQLRTRIGDWTHRDYPLLAPRPAAYPVTVRDVAEAGERSRAAVIDDWAISTWAAWSLHHGMLRDWLAALASGACQGRRTPRTVTRPPNRKMFPE